MLSEYEKTIFHGRKLFGAYIKAYLGWKTNFFDWSTLENLKLEIVSAAAAAARAKRHRQAASERILGASERILGAKMLMFHWFW